MILLPYGVRLEGRREVIDAARSAKDEIQRACFFFSRLTRRPNNKK